MTVREREHSVKFRELVANSSLKIPHFKRCSYIPFPCGGVPERLNGAVSKTVVLFLGNRGFESHLLRQFTKF